MMGLMDKQYDLCPAMGVRQTADYLKGEGYHVGKKLDATNAIEVLDRAVARFGTQRRGIAKYMDYYNNRRHQGLAHRTPGVMYAVAAA